METGIESISLPTKEVAPSEIQRLEWVFGKEAEINQKENGEWSVETRLESRGIIIGGQEINLTLSEKEDKQVGFTLEGGGVYKIQKMKIGNKEIVLPTEVYIQPEKKRKELESFDIDKSKNVNRLGDIETYFYKIFSGDFPSAAATPDREVVMHVFRAPEDLVVLMHELGHTQIDSEPIGIRVLIRAYSAINKSQESGEPVSEEIINTMTQYLKNENKASTWAVDKINKLQEEGVHMFSGDSDLVRIKLQLSLMMSTYLMGGGRNLGNLVDNSEQFLNFEKANINTNTN